VPLAWIVKLALAEVFRRPERALLPFRGDPVRRRVVTGALVLATYLAARWLAPASAPGSRASDVAFAACVVALLVLPRLGSAPRARGGLHAAVALALAVFANGRGVLWCASAPVLWTVLCALDDAAVGRRPRDPAPVEAGDRALWPMAKPLAILVPIGTAILAALRALA